MQKTRLVNLTHHFLTMGKSRWANYDCLYTTVKFNVNMVNFNQRKFCLAFRFFIYILYK